MEIGTWLLMAGLAYGFGVFWYSLFPGHMPGNVWRVAAYPFFLMFVGETFFSYGPAFGGLHPITAAAASLVGILIDWAIVEMRHPAFWEMKHAPAGA